MIILDPCRKCIVRACCTIGCEIKRKQIRNIESIFFKINSIEDSIINVFSWLKHKWPEILGILIIIVEIWFIILLS